MATGLLTQRAQALVAEVFRDIVVPLYFREDIQPLERKHPRGRPQLYLTVAKALVREFGLNTIVEIGSMRQPMTHRLAEFKPECCNDGHSTMHFASTGAELFTVDINPDCAIVLLGALRNFPKLQIVTGDGIWFLEQFEGTIDLLYLDAWDVIAGTPYAENHLAAYRAAKPRLAPRSVIVIDDTDIMNGGKGRLAIPEMIQDGFTLIVWGRQTLLVREGPA
jgi:hypothetical protein